MEGSLGFDGSKGFRGIPRFWRDFRVLKVSLVFNGSQWVWRDPRVLKGSLGLDGSQQVEGDPSGFREIPGFWRDPWVL